MAKANIFDDKKYIFSKYWLFGHSMFGWKQYWKIIQQITCLSIGDVRVHLGEIFARIFGTFSNAFLVNKRGLFLQKYQCFEMLAVN